MKKIKNIVLTLMLMFVGTIGANALTKSDLDYIESDFNDLIFWFTEYNEDGTQYFNTFREDETPESNSVADYVFWNMIWLQENKQYKYITNQDFEENGDLAIVQIPAETFEDKIKKNFTVNESFIGEIRENFSPSFSKNSGYKEISGKFYYYSEQMYNLGSAIELFPLVMGYKDLGSDCYLVYYYGTEQATEEDLSDPTNTIIERNLFDEQIKYVVRDYFVTKVEYKGGNIKYLSFEYVLPYNQPDESELILYKNLIDEDLKDEKEEIKEENKEETKVEINVNDKTWKEFLIELSKTSGEIEYGEDYLIYEYVSFEGSGDVGNLFTNTAKFSYKDGILKLDANNTEGNLDYIIYTIMNYMMKDSKYGEKNSLISSMFEPYKEHGLNNKFKLETDGIEYTIKHPLTEEEQANNTCTACHYSPIYESFAIDLKNGLNMENLKKFHKGINAYKYLDGEEQKFNINDKKQLTFRIDADVKLFEGIYIDGEEVEKKYYTITEGSTVVTFTDEYSKKLADGNHTLKVTFTDGKQAITEFKVDTKIENVSTGVRLGFGILTLITIISVIGYFLIRKQSKFPKHN